MDNEHIESVQKESEREEFKRDHSVREDDEKELVTPPKSFCCRAKLEEALVCTECFEACKSI